MDSEEFTSIRTQVGDDDTYAMLSKVLPVVAEFEAEGYTKKEILDTIALRPEILSTPATQAQAQQPAQADQVPEQPQVSGTGAGQIVGGLATEIAIAESGRIGGTLAGAKVGGAITAATGGTGVLALPVATGIGYVVGSLTGGASGSIFVQKKIEGRDNINYGRVIVDSLLNLVPGAGKVTKAGKTVEKVTGAMARNRIKSTAALGAIAAPASVAGSNLYEQGSIGEIEELLAASAMGAAFGSGIGYTSKKGGNILRRLAGKPTQELNRAVYGGDMDAVSFVDIVTRDVDPTKFLQAQDAKAYLADLGNFASSRLAPSRTVGEKSAQLMREAKSVTMAGREIGGILGTRIDKKISQSADPQATTQLVADFVTGKTKALPPELKDIEIDLSESRKFIHEYQQQLLDLHYSGEKPLPDLLRAKIEDSMTDGSYLTRTYRFFDDPTWRPSKKLREDAERELVATGMSKTEAQKYLLDLNTKRAGSDADVLSIVYSSNPRILREKKYISPAVRAYLGEYVSPGEKITSTMSALSRHAAYSKADGEISKALQDTGMLKAVSQTDPVPEGWNPIKLRTGPAVATGPQGQTELYGPPELQRAINELYASKVDSAIEDTATRNIADFWETGVAMSKAAKVLGNPPAYMVQFYGNLSQLLGMGMNPFRGSKAGLKVAMGQFADMPGGGRALNMPIADLNEFKRLKELGLVPSGLQFADMQAGLKQGKAGKIAGKAIEPLGKAYSVPDLAMRVIAFKNYQKFLAKAAPTAPIEKVEKLAAEYTNHTYPNYDYINSSLKTLSRKGVLLSHFASFTLEMFRTQWNQGKLASKMVFTPDALAKEMANQLGAPVSKRMLQAEGVKRTAALSAVYVGTAYGMDKFTREIGGVSEKEEQAYRRTVFPEWDKNRPLLIRKRNDGQIESINASYLVPHMQMAAPALAAIRGESFEDGFKKATSALKEDLTGEGSVVMHALSQAINNSSYKTKMAISSQPDGMKKAQEIGLWFVKELFTPGIVREVEKSRVNPVSQTVMRQAGIRINNTTIEDGFRFKTRELKEAINMSQKEVGYAKNKMDRGEFSPDDFARRYHRANSAFKANMARLVTHVKDLRTLGKSENEIFKMMREYGVGAERAIEAYDGIVEDLPAFRPETTADKYDEIIMRVGKDGFRNEAYSMLKTNPDAAKALVEHHKRILKDDKLNVSEREKTLRALDSNDGSRAAFIFRELKRNPQAAQAIKQQYIRKGVINASVARQLRVMEAAAGNPFKNAGQPGYSMQDLTQPE